MDVLQRGHAEAAEPLEQAMQDGDSRPCVRESPVTRLGVRAEEPGQRGQRVVRGFIPGQGLPGDPEGVQIFPLGNRVTAAYARLAQEAQIERGVVGDQDATVGELQKSRQHGADGRRGGDHRVGDSGQDRDERRYRRGRAHKGRHLREDLTAVDLDRAEFGDLAVGAAGTGGLKVHDNKGDLPQGPAQLLETGLSRLGAGRGRRRLRRGAHRRGLVAAARRLREQAHVRAGYRPPRTVLPRTCFVP